MAPGPSGVGDGIQTWTCFGVGDGTQIDLRANATGAADGADARGGSGDRHLEAARRSLDPARPISNGNNVDMQHLFASAKRCCISTLFPFDKLISSLFRLVSQARCDLRSTMPLNSDAWQASLVNGIVERRHNEQRCVSLLALLLSVREGRKSEWKVCEAPLSRCTQMLRAAGLCDQGLFQA